MRRLLLSTLCVPVLVLAVAIPGCSKKEEDDTPPPKRGGRGDPVVAKSEPLKADGYEGVITGRIVLDGAAPTVSFIATLDTHQDKACCTVGAEDFEKKEQRWIIGKDNGVANVVIFLKAPGGSYFDMKPEDKNRKDEVVLDQPHCAFVPHVVAIFPAYRVGPKSDDLKPSGQKFTVKNSANCQHNSKLTGDPTKNPLISKTLTPKSDFNVALSPQSGPIQVVCDIHPWMNAKIWAFDHPFSAVTKADGTFKIENVPTGVEVSLVTWHEGVEFFNGGKDGVKMKFNAGENKVGDIKLTVK